MEGYKNRNETVLCQLNVHKSPAYLFNILYVIEVQVNDPKTSWFP